MATSASDIETSYPISTYRFQVTVGEDTMAFNKISGLKSGRETMDYRDGMGGLFRMVGQKTLVDFTLSRGVVSAQSQLYDWLLSANRNEVDKKDILISLTDESGSTLLITWNVFNAFPTELSAPDFDATSNDVAIEELSLSADSMTIEYH